MGRLGRLRPVPMRHGRDGDGSGPLAAWGAVKLHRPSPLAQNFAGTAQPARHAMRSPWPALIPFLLFGSLTVDLVQQILCRPRPTELLIEHFNDQGGDGVGL